ncbi:MAG: hypothetical protein EPO22_03165 [Dehalococcoidia bacterium]|nr:MAG: hypothetical protein EPO22_03165 [Dehalococcoidia bacterium]
MTTQVLEQGRIVESKSAVTLEQSVSVFTTATVAAGTSLSPEIAYFIASEPVALDAVSYPSLAAVWDNEEDAIFDDL